MGKLKEYYGKRRVNTDWEVRKFEWYINSRVEKIATRINVQLGIKIRSSVLNFVLLQVLRTFPSAGKKLILECIMRFTQKNKAYIGTQNVK